MTDPPDSVRQEVPGAGNIFSGTGPVTVHQHISEDDVTQRELNTKSPYRGLEYFDKEHEGYFFGRDQLIADLEDQFDQTSLLLVHGASGSGKSSVVRAGLLS